MAMIKLPNNIQSLFCSSTQINSYKRAIEELVCNSLDAESTSIAIRCNIDENAIQVIDNGFGVAHCDFTLLGQRHATSNCVDLSTLKSAPNKYGFRGQALASIIDVSKSVKITSRNENKEETLVKTFHKGKEHGLSTTAPRPSKGTTVEIKGFLYNLNIQNKAINALEEINEIKLFLKQLSLVHSNISISLRDDIKSEIIFKLHKNRDIYQTLSSIFGVENSDVQELRVEKNEYKVTAIIGKQYKDVSQCHWIYLNRKFVHSSKLHEIINDKLTKSLGLKYQTKRKSKNDYNEADDLSRNKIPFYFIFITCPYYDYDICNTTKQSLLEFKNWDHINKLLEKLVKFYTGNNNLKEVTKTIKNQDDENKELRNNTTDQVRKLIQEILGSKSKRPGISQMHKGIKGKLIKRKYKTKKNNLTNVNPPKDNDNNNAQRTSKEIISPSDRKIKEKIVNISLSKIIPLKKNTNHDYEIQKSLQANTLHPKGSIEDSVIHLDFPNLNEVPQVMKKTKTRKKRLGKTKIRHASGQSGVQKTLLKGQNYTNPNGLLDKDSTKINRRRVKKILRSNKAENPHNVKMKINKSVGAANPKKKKDATNTRKNMIDPLILNFEIRDSVKMRCDTVAKEVDELITKLRNKKKRKRKIFVNKTVQYSNVIRNNTNVSIQKKVGEIVIHDHVPLPPKFYPCSIDNHVCDGLTKNHGITSYNLLHTIIKSQHTNNRTTVDEGNLIEGSSPHCEFDIISYSEQPREIDNIQPKLTFESHDYQNRNRHFPNPSSNNKIANCNRKDTNVHFITKQSRDNFVPQDICCTRKLKTGFRKPFNFKTKAPYEKKATVIKFPTMHKKIQNLVESSYTIEFSPDNGNYFVQEENKENTVTDLQVPLDLDNDHGQIGMTYTVSRNDEYILHSSKIGSTYTVFSNSSHMIDDNNVNHAGFKDTDYNEAQRIHSRESSNRCYCSTQIENVVCPNEENLQEANVLNAVFVSESQEDNNEMLIDASIDPVNICDTELRNIEQFEGDLEFNKQDESWCNDIFDVGSLICDRNAYIHTAQASCQVVDTHKTIENISHHFDSFQKSDRMNELCGNEAIVLENNDRDTNLEERDPIENNVNIIEPLPGFIKDLQLQNGDSQTIVNDLNNFIFKHRLRFVPKGMSQIFENCQSKTVRDYKCQSKTVRDYNCQEEYYEKTIYDNFANDVQANSEIFEPKIQNVKELASRDIEKVNIRLNNENASLIFNGDSLKQAHILCQVDDKFIATKMKGRSGNLTNMAEYLILFDQHAVHERIRLEKNLADYLSDDQWKSVTMDHIPLKLTKGAVLYLHNYKDKFAQFGLQWTILNNTEITVTAIPEAILGKNPRQVELVMKAVKNLIFEEINAIKLQKGCISLYPKAIMDLVFSEACRYAVKFGDNLSKVDCVNLLTSLSECKTPFQCAHGRPVMAVVMKVKSEKRAYKINKTKIYQFIKSTKKN